MKNERSLAEILSRYVVERNKKGATSSRSALIQDICEYIATPLEFEKILGQTKQMTVEEIQEIFDTAISWKKNPRALFWKLIRQKQEEIKEKLEKEK